VALRMAARASASGRFAFSSDRGCGLSGPGRGGSRNRAGAATPASSVTAATDKATRVRTAFMLTPPVGRRLPESARKGVTCAYLIVRAPGPPLHRRSGDATMKGGSTEGGRMTRKAVVLLSGGLDSATALAAARCDGFACHALTIAYGQRHAVELEAAERVARALGAVEHRTMCLDLCAFGGSALTADIPVPRD